MALIYVDNALTLIQQRYQLDGKLLAKDPVFIGVCVQGHCLYSSVEQTHVLFHDFTDLVLLEFLGGSPL